MKTILIITALLITLTACNQNPARTQAQSSTLAGNHIKQVGDRFVSTFVNKPNEAYRYLDQGVRSRLSPARFQQFNSQLFNVYGTPVSFNQSAAKPVRSVRALPNGSTQQEMTLWYPVKTSKDMSGQLRLKLSFSHQGGTPAISRYTFMRPRH